MNFLDLAPNLKKKGRSTVAMSTSRGPHFLWDEEGFVGIRRAVVGWSITAVAELLLLPQTEQIVCRQERWSNQTAQRDSFYHNEAAEGRIEPMNKIRTRTIHEYLFLPLWVTYNPFPFCISARTEIFSIYSSGPSSSIIYLQVYRQENCYIYLARSCVSSK